MAKSLMHICESVNIGGREYKINTDFRVWIEIERLLFEKSTNDEERLAKILVSAYPVLPPDPIEAIEKIIWFYSGGEICEKESGQAPKAPVYDLQEDFDYVWGAFKGEFGIDLTNEKMHWWKFRVLLGCLSDECFFSKVVGYRSMDLSLIKDKEQRRFFERMKKRFRLPGLENTMFGEEQMAENLAAAFD